MPPVTPSATRLIALLVAAGRRSRLDFLDRPGDHLALGDGGLLVFAHVDAGRRSGEQLPRPGPGRDDELESILELGGIAHENVLTISSAAPRIRCRRARAAMTMLRSRSTAAVTSSLTTTKSYSENAATSSRATCRRRWISGSLSLLRPRSRCSRIANDGRITNTVLVRTTAARTFRAPCTSMTRTTSCPPASRPSVSAAQVP